MRNLFLTLSCLWSACAVAADDRVVVLSADRSSYQVGERAILGARLVTKPDNPNLEFDLVSKLNNVEIPITRVTDYDFYSVAMLPTAGPHQWKVFVYIQDARIARDLKTAIASFQARIAQINILLETEEDLGERQLLLSSRAEQERFLAAAQDQLISIRSQIYGPVNLNLVVN